MFNRMPAAVPRKPMLASVAAVIAAGAAVLMGSTAHGVDEPAATTILLECNAEIAIGAETGLQATVTGDQVDSVTLEYFETDAWVAVTTADATSGVAVPLVYADDYAMFEVYIAHVDDSVRWRAVAGEFVSNECSQSISAAEIATSGFGVDEDTLYWGQLATSAPRVISPLGRTWVEGNDLFRYTYLTCDGYLVRDGGEPDVATTIGGSTTSYCSPNSGWSAFEPGAVEFTASLSFRGHQLGAATIDYTVNEPLFEFRGTLAWNPDNPRSQQPIYDAETRSMELKEGEGFSLFFSTMPDEVPYIRGNFVATIEEWDPETETWLVLIQNPTGSLQRTGNGASKGLLAYEEGTRVFRGVIYHEVGQNGRGEAFRISETVTVTTLGWGDAEAIISAPDQTPTGSGTASVYFELPEGAWGTCELRISYDGRTGNTLKSTPCTSEDVAELRYTVSDTRDTHLTATVKVGFSYNGGWAGFQTVEAFDVYLFYSEPYVDTSNKDVELRWLGLGDDYSASVQYWYRGEWFDLANSEQAVTDGRGDWEFEWPHPHPRTYRFVATIDSEIYYLPDFFYNYGNAGYTTPFYADWPESVLSGTSATLAFWWNTDFDRTSVMSLEASDGGPWEQTGKRVRMQDGRGTFVVHPLDPDSYYRACVDHGDGFETCSGWVLVHAVPVVATGTGGYVIGASTTLGFSIDADVSGTASLQYRTNGGTWKTSPTGVKIVHGEGSRVVRPSGVREYRIVFKGSTSNVVTLTPILPTITPADDVQYVPGSSARIAFTVDPVSSGTATLQYRTDGGSWNTASSGVKIVNGYGARTVNPSGVREYRIIFGGATSEAITLTPIVPGITASEDAFYVPGSSARISFTVDPSSSGSATLQYRTDGGAWNTASSGVTITDGVGSRSVRPSGVREYRIVFGGATSDAVTLTPIVPTITASDDGAYVAGSSVRIAFTVEPVASGTATLQYRTDGGSWKTSSSGVKIVNGYGSRMVNPSGVREYRIVLAGATSDAVTLTPIVPTITVSADAFYYVNSPETITFTIDPVVSGKATLQYRTNGGAWRTSSSGVTITNGVGSRTVRPSGVREYRIVYGGTVSPSVKLTPVPAELFASGPATYTPGSSVLLTFGANRLWTGTATLQYRTNGGQWVTSGSGVTIYWGLGSRTVTPSGIREYRIIMNGVISNVVTLVPASR